MNCDTEYPELNLKFIWLRSSCRGRGDLSSVLTIRPIGETTFSSFGSALPVQIVYNPCFEPIKIPRCEKLLETGFFVENLNLVLPLPQPIQKNSLEF